MNISGTVRLDLAPHVRHGHLVVGDRAMHDISRVVLGRHTGVYELDIGDASRVDWDERIFLLLSHAERVVIVGSHELGVGQAVSSLESVFAAVPGPRSAS